MRKDITGQRFERLVAVRFSHMRNETSYWLFKCNCGKEKVIRSDGVKSGAVQSCGCLASERARLRQHKMCYRHGYAGTKVYITWKGIQQRCRNAKEYPRYAGRGIRCLWNSFEEFYKDMGEPPSDKHSIERIDNNGDYCKDNCKWATKKEQANNRSTCVLVAYQGRQQNLKQWAVEMGLPYKTAWYRLNAGWSIEKTLTTKVRLRFNPTFVI